MMSYAEFLRRTSFGAEELVAFAEGDLISDTPAGFTGRLPAHPMLMLHRINHLERDGARGSIIAECDVGRDDWFFDCHFRGDPVQPGCLGVDAVWQLLGFFCLWSGAVGSGRALGCKEVVFDGEIRPWNHVVRYEVSVRRIAGMSSSETTVAIGTGRVFVDDRQVYTIRDAKTGVFPNIARTESEHAAQGAR